MIKRLFRKFWPRKKTEIPCPYLLGSIAYYASDPKTRGTFHEFTGLPRKVIS